MIPLPVTLDDVWETYSLMLYPNAKAGERKQFVEEQQFHIAVNNGLKHDRYDIDESFLSRIREFKTEQQLTRKMEAESKGGLVAGSVLLYLFLMYKFEIVNEPSLNKAQFVVENSKFKFDDGKARKYHNKDIKVYWKRFRPVVHLWAAMRMNSAYPYAPQDELFTNVHHFKTFLQVALMLQDFATSFIPARAKNPIIDRALCFGVPANIGRLELDCKNPPENMIEILKNYKSSN